MSVESNGIFYWSECRACELDGELTTNYWLARHEDEAHMLREHSEPEYQDVIPQGFTADTYAELFE